MKEFGKRGSHVGVMISFSIFIIFLLSILLLINPALKEKEGKLPVLNSLHQIILENLSSNLTLTLLKISDTYNPLENCLSFNGGDGNQGENIVVKNFLDERIASEIDVSTVKVDWTEKDRFLKIYSSLENFEEMPLGAGACASPIEDTEFFVNSIKMEKYIFESNIAKLNTTYGSSYPDLKEYLGIPVEEEFGFGFVNSDGILSMESGKEPSSQSIYSKEIQIIYINNQSNLVPGVIRLKVW